MSGPAPALCDDERGPDPDRESVELVDQDRIDRGLHGEQSVDVVAANAIANHIQSFMSPGITSSEP